MFAHNLRTQFVLCGLLIPVVLLNSLGVSVMAVQAEADEVSSISPNSQDTEQKGRTVSTDAHPSNDSKGALQSQLIAKAELATSPVFVENIGQFDPRARFQAQSNGANIYFSDDAIWFTLLEPPAKNSNQDPQQVMLGKLEGNNQKSRKGVNLKINLVGSNPDPVIEPFNRVVTNFSYFTGSDQANWHSDVPVWGGIRYIDIYPGMDLEITSEGDRLLWQFLITDTSRFYDKNNRVAQQGIRMKIAGHQKLEARNKNLEITTEVGILSLPDIRLNGVEILPQIDNNGELNVPIPIQTSISSNLFKAFPYVGGSGYSDAFVVKIDD